MLNSLNHLSNQLNAGVAPAINLYGDTRQRKPGVHATSVDKIATGVMKENSPARTNVVCGHFQVACIIYSITA